MNRRSFIRSLIAAPIAAAVAPMAAKQAYATGGVVTGPMPLTGEHVRGYMLGAEAVARNNAEMMRHVLMQSDKLSPLIDNDAFDRLSEWLDTPVEAEHLSTAIPMGMTGC